MKKYSHDTTSYFAIDISNPRNKELGNIVVALKARRVECISTLFNRLKVDIGTAVDEQLHDRKVS